MSTPVSLGYWFNPVYWLGYWFNPVLKFKYFKLQYFSGFT